MTEGGRNSVGLSDRLDNAGSLLRLLQERVKQNFSWEEKRELVELLVSEILVDTHGQGTSKRSEITVTYAFDGGSDNRMGRDSWLQLT